MNFKLKMRFVILAHFSPSIPPRGVVAISPLFHFRRKGKYRLLEQRRKFPTSEILKISEALTNDISFYEGVVTCLFAILRFGTRSSQLFFLTFLRLHFI
jgi:hypothetical protein